MNGNPFYVDPGNNYGSGLAGLSQSVRHLGEQKTKQRAEEKYEKMKMEATAVFATKDPDKISKFMIENPEMAKAMEISYGFYDKATKENYLKGAYRILEAHERLKETGGSAVTPPRKPFTTVVPPEGEITAAGEYPYDPGILGLEEPPGTPFLNAESKPVEFTETPELPPEIAAVLNERKSLLSEKGVPVEQTKQTDAFAAAYSADSEAAIQKIKHDVATMDPKGWKAWKEIYDPENGETSSSPLKKLMTERDALKKSLAESGMSSENIAKNQDVIDFQNKISGKQGDGKEKISPHLRLINERDAFVKDLTDSGVTPEEAQKDPDVISFNRKILGENKEWAPTSHRKLILEREDLKAKLREEGLTEDQIIDHPDVISYDDQISGFDTTVRGMWTQDKIDVWGAMANLNNGKIPSVGRGKNAGLLRQMIAMSAAKQALGNPQFGGKEGLSPSQAALNVVAMSADTKAIGSAINFLEKQFASMGSFIQNMDAQIERVNEISDDLYTFDARLLNIPWRFLRGKIAGSPLQAKYDMYLAELSREISKISNASTQSIAAMSVEEIKVWDRIHDKNLSVKDMLSLLQETRHAADLRLTSVEDQLNRTRSKLRTRDYGGKETYPEVSSQEQYDALKSGDTYINKSTGKQMRKP